MPFVYLELFKEKRAQSLKFDDEKSVMKISTMFNGEYPKHINEDIYDTEVIMGSTTGENLTFNKYRDIICFD